MTKKIIAGVIALSAVFAFVATVANAQSTGYVFTTNLTIGSSGSDVVALQTYLESKGYLVMPVGVAKGYFGSLTQSALAKYQSAKGITPAVGYFGPITRAAVSADAGTTPVTTTPGCPAGAMYNYLTGAPCTTSTSTVPGCAAGAAYSSTTGAPCTTTSTPTTSGVEGTLEVRQSGSPANNANIQSSNADVYGLTLKATIADVTVDRIDLQVGVSTGGWNATETPSSLINTITLKDGSSVIKSWSVSSADFIKDPNNSSNYYVRLSGLGYVVPKDVTKTLVLSFTTNSGIDTDRYVYIKGYGTNSLRAVSGNGITSYYDISNIVRTHTFKKPGTGTLTVSSDANTPDSNNNKVSTTDGIMGVTVGTFNVKAETGDVTVTDVVLPIYASGTAPSTVYIYDGSTMLDSRAGASGNITFNNLNVSVPKDVTKTLTVKVDMPSSIATGTSVAISSTTLTVTYTKPNGNTASATQTNLSVGTQYFYTAAPQLTFVSASASANTLGQAASTTNVSGSFTFKVRPVGSSMTALSASDVKISTTTTGSEPAGISKTITVTPNDSTYAEGGDYTVTVNFLVPNSGIATTGLYTFYVKSIAWTMGNGTAVTQTYGLDDYKTNAVSFTK